MAEFYSGTSGLVLPVPNKEYYPAEFKEGTRLRYYASLFNSIEINTSFYKIPRAQTIAKWAEDVPDDFKFTFKLWQGITHEKGLMFDLVYIDHFMQAIDAAGSHKGCLLIQLPPGAKVGLMSRLRQLIDHIQRTDPAKSWKLALEFRHPSWYSDELAAFAEDEDLSVVIQDIPASATPLYFAKAEMVYVRFHGPGGKYQGSYPVDVLQEYSSYIHEWRQAGQTVYAYFNNTIGDAVRNLATLNTMV